jgi:hybrid cluster-associated redox disulfide protein
MEVAISLADPINSDMLIRDVLVSHEGAAEIFSRHGLSCAGCMAAEMETLSAVATMHDISVDVLIDDLNALVADEGE